MKTSTDLKNSFQAVCDFCASYPSVRGGLPTGDPRSKEVILSLRTIADWLRDQFAHYNGVPIQIVVSEGAGAFPRVPWICLLPPGQRVNEGIYVGICFGKAGNGAVAGCMESATAPQGLETVKRASSNEAPVIDVDGISNGTRYNNVFENPLDVFRDAFDAGALSAHVGNSLGLALTHVQITTPPALVRKKLGESVKTSFVEAALQAGVAVNGFLAQRMISAFLSKRFTIFTGLSGSGKTLIAQSFAHWIASGSLGEHAKEHFTVIPVGADWTGNESILGYPDGLQRGNYLTKPALDLMLHAEKHGDFPHFLILDEMNLSHVERYFADILSGIESDEGLELYSGDMTKPETWRKTSAAKPVPPKLKQLPENLFIIGTVNVDETTYMFSPKVLDRANVIEFRMDAGELEGFLGNPAKPDLSKLDGKGASFGKAFVDAAKNPVAVPADVKAAYDAEMVLLFRTLQAHGAEFGYRTAYETARFVHFYKLLGNHPDGDPAWFSGALDCVVFQKLLPKLHGSRAKLGPVLKKLWFLCVTPHKVDAETKEDRDNLIAATLKAAEESKAEPLKDTPDGAPYPLSAEKIYRMWRLMMDNGFASFAEA